MQSRGGISGNHCFWFSASFSLIRSFLTFALLLTNTHPLLLNVKRYMIVELFMGLCFLALFQILECLIHFSIYPVKMSLTEHVSDDDGDGF